ncbi:MAG: DUF4834 family protein [Bacteroidetes bacterium]|nr:DUF4834 family protein [Bacteroidota bacterium]MBU1718303.1 DUF4834 family protein [Bacteroidota bacterium]
MLEFLAWFFIVIIALRILAKLLLPYLLRSFMRRMQRRMMGNEEFSKQSSRKTGDVHIDYVPENNSSQHNDNDGEYVDFEEIK